MTAASPTPYGAQAEAATRANAAAVAEVARPADALPVGRYRMLALISMAALLGVSLWFAPNAAGPQLAARWELDPAGLGLLTGAVALGFVVGTAAAALLNLADLWPARWYVAASALLAALSNAALLVAPGLVAGIVTRFMTGVFLAGVYPPAMKMAATWFRSGRGLAIGLLVGAISVGKAVPYLAHALGRPSVVFIALTTSGGALLAAALVATFYRDGPFPFERRPFDWGLVGTVVRDRETRLATFGYLGHMWELYAMWAWAPAFIAASAATLPVPPPRWVIDLVAFGTLAAGGLGAWWGGWAAGRMGYARVVTIAMAVSGVCCLGMGLLYGAPLALLAPAVWLWGFFVVADSAQFSAMVTEVVARHAVGTALTLQVSCGFLLTLATIQMVPLLVGAIGWRWAFAILAIGPALGIAAIARLGPSTRGRDR